MKKVIVVFEAVLLSLLIAITSLIIAPRHKGEEISEPITYPPVVIQSEYDPFAQYKLEGYSSNEIFTYFSEVVHTAEYSDGAFIHQLVQKWTEPIRYRIYGDPTDEDMAVLTEFFQVLNSMYYFPGISEADDGEEENLTIYFIDRHLFDITFGETVNHEVSDGAAEYWFYTDTNEIYSGRIGYVIDTDQETRSSVIIEELVNVLGIADCYTREDSVVYQFSSTNTELSEMDKLIIKALYHPLIQPGMTADECQQTPLFNY